MHPAQPQYDVGVLIGRFQVPELHDAHLELIQYVVDRHDKVLILLGNSPIPNSISNPLDYPSRMQMIKAKFPDVFIAYIDDTRDDDSWRRAVDREIGKFLDFGQSVVIYGGRDSFIPHYVAAKGKHPTQELTQETFESGTAVRKKIAAGAPWNHEAYRAGLVKASMSRYPTGYVALDCVIWDYVPDAPEVGRKPRRVLLGRKPSEKLFRFVGGFLDPEKDSSLEDGAWREAHEECGLIELEAPVYLGSVQVDDWRYRKEKDKIFSALFSMRFLFGRPEPSDDLDGGDLKWFDLDKIRPTDVVPEHRPLLDLVIQRLA